MALITRVNQASQKYEVKLILMHSPIPTNQPPIITGNINGKIKNIYIYIYIYIYIDREREIYIYIYIDRERERETQYH